MNHVLALSDPLVSRGTAAWRCRPSSRLRPGQLAVPQNTDSVDQHVVDAHRDLPRCEIVGPVRHPSAGSTTTMSAAEPTAMRPRSARPWRAAVRLDRCTGCLRPGVVTALGDVPAEETGAQRPPPRGCGCPPEGKDTVAGPEMCRVTGKISASSSTGSAGPERGVRHWQPESERRRSAAARIRQGTYRRRRRPEETGQPLSLPMSIDLLPTPRW